MEFINLKNGLTYNGSKPFIHYFECGKSINLNHEMKLCFLHNSQKVRVSLDSEVFSILDISKAHLLHNTTIMSQKTFIDLKRLKVKELESTGYEYDGRYIHIVYILAHSTICGDIVDVIKIGHDEVLIGGDFYGEDERLKNSLENFENVVPQSIQRAIYECNVHEESNDNILLNRKYKELLQNYWNICMSKGSYNSLVDSLAWFEWGDLVRLEEYWRRQDPQGEVLMQFDVEKMLNNELRQMLGEISKTTFYGLYCCLYKAMPDMFDEEDNPLLENILMRWSVEDISLKMILLGNFYQTYFMPIHLDLLHASIEHWVFTVNQKIMNYNSIEFNNTYNNVKTFVCGFEETIRMKPTYLYFYDDTLFKEATTPVGDTMLPINLGCSTAKRQMTSNTTPARYFNGICAVNKFVCHIPQVNIKHSKIICRNIDGTTIYSYDDMVYGTGSTFSFEVMFDRPGQWNVVLHFETIDSDTYSKEINVYVDETIYNTIDLYKLVYSVSGSMSDKTINTLEDLVMNLTDDHSKYELKNTYYIHKDRAKLNHVVIYEIPEGTDMTLTYGNSSITINRTTTSLVNRLMAHIPQYMWFLLEGTDMRIAGIARKPNTDVTSEVSIKYHDNLEHRYVNEHRFVLGFYKLEPFTGYKVTADDIIVAIPRFKYSLPVDECYWNFRNDSTQEDNESFYYKEHYNRETSPAEYNGDFGHIVDTDTGTAGNMLLYKKPKDLTKGFYSIFLKYRYADEVQESHLKSAFYI